MSPVELLCSNFERENQFLFFIEPAWSLYVSVCVEYVRALSASCVVISADLAGRYSLISPSIRWQSFHHQPSAYNIAYYTKCQLFGDPNHVTVSRQRPESDCFVILAAHVIGTQHQRATLRPTQRESVTGETKVSVLCRHIFNSQDQSWKGKKGPQTNILCFHENKPTFVGWLWTLMSLSWFSLSVTSGPTISQMASSGGAHQLRHRFCFFVTRAYPPTPLLKHACIHLKSQK